MTHTRSAIITIDGPAGTGKSSVASQLAGRLGLEFLDTGAMYRAATVVAIESEVDLKDGPALASAVRAAQMHFDWATDPPRIMLGDRDVSERIRDLDVSERVSVVAAQPELRAVLIERQRAIGAAHPRLVTEGRDQGSAVFPNAPLRFFLHADEAIRAERRVRQLRDAGKTVDIEVIRADIQRRDRLDAGRRDSPLVRPDGAIDLDTTRLTLAEVVDEMERVARRRLPDAGFFDAEKASAGFDSA